MCCDRVGELSDGLRYPEHQGELDRHHAVASGMFFSFGNTSDVNLVQIPRCESPQPHDIKDGKNSLLKRIGGLFSNRIVGDGLFYGCILYPHENKVVCYPIPSSPAFFKPVGFSYHPSSLLKSLLFKGDCQPGQNIKNLIEIQLRKNLVSIGMQLPWLTSQLPSDRQTWMENVASCHSLFLLEPDCSPNSIPSPPGLEGYTNLFECTFLVHETYDPSGFDITKVAKKIDKGMIIHIIEYLSSHTRFLIFLRLANLPLSIFSSLFTIKNKSDKKCLINT